MRAWITRAGLITAGVAALCVLQCSNPTDQEPVAFRSEMQVPLTNQRFNLARELDAALRDEKSDTFQIVVQTGPNQYDTTNYPSLLVTRVVNVDSSYWGIVDATGDTIPVDVLGADSIDGQVVFVEVPEREIDSFPITVDSMEDKRFEVRLGPIPLSSLQLTGTLPYGTGTPYTSPAAPLNLAGISYIGFSAGSAPMTISFENLGTSAVNNLVVNIEGLGSTTPVNVPALGSAQTSIPTAGQALPGSPQVSLSANTSAAGSLNMVLSMSGLLADTVRVVDSLVQIDTFFVNDYDLTDTLDIDYVDIADGKFLYSMWNHTGLRLFVRGIHEDLWKSAYCRDMGLEDITDLEQAGASLDTAFREGKLMDTYVPVPPHTRQSFTDVNMADIRMFPQWDSSQSRCETYVRYEVRTPPPNGSMISLSSNDSAVFFISSPFMWGDAMQGRMALDYESAGDTQSVPIEYPFDEKLINAIRDGIEFERVPIDISVMLIMPQTSEIDDKDPVLGEVYIEYALWNPADNSVPRRVVSGTDTLRSATGNQVHRFTVDAQDILNQLPDSIEATFRATIPSGAEVFLVTDRVPYGVTTSSDSVFARMNIYVDLQYKVNLRLSYQVTQPTPLNLGANTFTLKGYSAATKLTDRSASLIMNITNNSNQYLRLKALMAPEELALGFKDLDETYIEQQLVEPGVTSDGYVNLLSPEGLRIPPRGQSYHNDIALTDEQLETIFKARQSGRTVVEDLDSTWDNAQVPPVFLGMDTTRATYEAYESRAGWWWRIELEQQDAVDALHDTDWVEINSAIYVNGVVSTDSLFSEW
ncbi:MAG: hypothetical protein GF331_23370 [Chitinivibrionales bacterium]|nr:hypothetical protein [Chitinivibrionales bacterium]